jgi:hypothetical protein
MMHEMLIERKKIIVFAQIKGINDLGLSNSLFKNIKFDFEEKTIET